MMTDILQNTMTLDTMPIKISSGDLALFIVSSAK